jgi:histidinol-phosphate/aromatic aminotransferase/cobyric acid decarboxylase-like protein/choline kinase
MQAIILAAGMGKRLKELTRDNTKCMVKVNDTTLIERMLSQLDRLNLSKIVIVIGYEGQKLVDFINQLDIKTKIVYVNNPIYYRTNNIYSLYLAKDYLLKEDTLLLESDLIFEDAVLDRIIKDSYPNLALVAKFESWMDGTVVKLDSDDNIKRFIPTKHFSFEEIPEYYKTVNIYKFSKDFSSSHYVPFLEAYCKALGHNEYYEQVLRVITLLDKPEIKAIRLHDELWYEIDDIQDLDIAESIFASPQVKLSKIQKRYGGYWRYPHLLDFCYLVNPFFPNQKLVDEIKANFERLLCTYPSGMQVNSLLAAKYFGIRQEHICIGNGASELIKSLMEQFTEKIGIMIPTFEEYPNRKKSEHIVPYYTDNENFTYGSEDLIQYYEHNKVNAIILINPDNPSGNFIKKPDVLQLVYWAKKHNITVIVDESFIDFVDMEESHSLLDEDILLKNKNLIVLKSISKSFGVPGLRLGVMACGNTDIISQVKKDVSIWNINSFAEFYMQIFEKYKADYQLALKKFRDVRKDFARNLQTINHLRVIPSQANYIMCEVLTPYNSTKLTEQLLHEHSILIKDLSNKNGLNNGQYIRVAVKTKEDNDALISALKKVLV